MLGKAQAWPSSADLVGADAGNAHTLSDVGIVLSGIRKAKSQAKVSMRTPVLAATVTGDQESLDRIRSASKDLVAAGRVEDLQLTTEGDDLSVVNVDLDIEDPA